MKESKKYIGLIFALILLSGCYYDNEEYLYPEVVGCDTTDIKFTEHIQPIIESRCATSGCHITGSSGNNIPFDNGYAQIKAKVDNGTLRQRVLVQKDMPPSGSLTSCQLSQIQTWLDAGAPNN